MLCAFTKKHYLCTAIENNGVVLVVRHSIGIWCNGNTTDSGPVFPGSSPGIPTESFLVFGYAYWDMV